MIANYNIPKAKVITLFGALCLFFALLEKLLPQVGFFRYGLSNLPILLALPIFRGRDVYLVMLLKVLGVAILHGTFAAHVFLLSFSGSLAATSIMLVAYRLWPRQLSLIGISVLGSLASNLVQLALGIGLIYGPGYLVLAPVLLGVGTISSILIGIFAQVIMGKSRWHHLVSGIYQQGKLPDSWPQHQASQPRLPFVPSWLTAQPPSSQKNRDRLGPHIPANMRFIWGMIILLVFLFLQTWWLKFALVVLFAVLALYSGKRIWFLYFILSTLSITVFNVLVPNGAIIWELGPFALTDDALFHRGPPQGLHLHRPWSSSPSSAIHPRPPSAGHNRQLSQLRYSSTTT
jgi:heptaprenyl diphosphate synthase